MPGAGARTAARRVTRFVEKPAPLLADQLIAGGAFWHTGILVANAGAVLERLAERTPELQPGMAALAAGKFDRFAGMIQSVSVERGLGFGLGRGLRDQRGRRGGGLRQRGEIGLEGGGEGGVERRRIGLLVHPTVWNIKRTNRKVVFAGFV